MCPRCGGAVRKYGKAKRMVRTKYRKSKWIEIQRLQCKVCLYVWRELPNDILPFKQYEREIIEGVQEGIINNDILGFEDYPCEITMRRWRAQK